MLVLLIIFMVTAPLLTQGVKVDLPKAGAGPLDPALLKNAIPLVLSMDRTGALYLNLGGGNPQAPLDAETVGVPAPPALRGNPEPPVRVKADNQVGYGSVVRAMVILQQAGARKVGFITDPLPDPKRHGH